MTTEIQVIPRHETAISTSDPESILRYAIDQKADIVLIERMMVVRDKLKAEKAKEMFDTALALFQSKCPIIEKRKRVGKEGSGFGYRYAPLDHIVSQVRGLLQECGFSFSLNSTLAGEMVKAVCTITHSGGHQGQSEFTAPIDMKSSMNLQQKYGAAMTFAKRYAFCNAFGILTGDEDTDGAVPPKPSGPSSLHSGSAAPTNSEKLLKRALIDATRKIHRVEAGYALDETALGAITQWLVDEALIADTESVADLSGDRLVKAVEKAKGIR